MPRRYGIQSEILVSLVVLIVTATGILVGLLLKTHESRMLQTRSLMASALREDAASPIARVAVPGQRWWTLTPDDRVLDEGGESTGLDDASLALAREARVRRSPLLRGGMPWEPIRFAAPLERAGYVSITTVPAAASPAALIATIVGDVLVLTIFGGYVLRKRVVVPMQRLAQASREVADGALESRLPIGVVRESAEVALAFNEMAASLENRTHELEKAVRELRQSNRQLRDARVGLDRAERLAAVGRLAAGVAHEIGNPMGAVLAFLDLTKRDPGISETSREYLGKAAREGERIRVILRQVLEFSSPPRGAKVPVDLSSICEETASLLRAQRRYDGISIRVDSEGDPPEALADVTGVSQILLNLLMNAADAIRESDTHASHDGGEQGACAAVDEEGPHIRITVRPAIRNVRAADRGEPPTANRRGPDVVECVVQDNGTGIASEDRERIFDPFFTTKAPGEGTGLGLSNAARLAEELGGAVTLDVNAEGPGARFVLRLPAVGDPNSSDSAVRASR